MNQTTRAPVGLPEHWFCCRGWQWVEVEYWAFSSTEIGVHSVQCEKPVIFCCSTVWLPEERSSFPLWRWGQFCCRTFSLVALARTVHWTDVLCFWQRLTGFCRHLSHRLPPKVGYLLQTSAAPVDKASRILVRAAHLLKTDKDKEWTSNEVWGLLRVIQKILMWKSLKWLDVSKRLPVITNLRVGSQCVCLPIFYNSWLFCLFCPHLGTDCC